MDTSAGANPFPHLRLVRAPENGSSPPKRLSDARSPLAALERVADENRRAARMAAGSAGPATGAHPGDALEILAIRTAECLDGGRAAILRPERRRRLLRIAHMLGVGQFDANLVFAIVQDNARRGATPESAAQDTRLSVLAPRRQRCEVSAAAWIIPQVFGALCIAALMLFALIRWIGG